MKNLEMTRAVGEGGGTSCLYHYDAFLTKIDMWFIPKEDKHLNMKMRVAKLIKSHFF